MNKYPNILIISNNAISDTNNNGKTIGSIFADYPEKKVRQLYFNSEKPTGKKINSFFRITDREMLDSFLRKSDSAGNEQQNLIESENSNNAKSSIQRNNTTRIIREIVWKNSNWKSQELSNWLNEFSPDVIFFVAGDTGFTYDIVFSIKNKYNTKLITYITDDYILPRKTVNLFWWIRRNSIFNKMKKAINQSELLLTISPKMKKVYSEIFNKNSTVVSNMTNSLSLTNNKFEDKNYIKLIYAGGLHYNRYQVLEKLGKAILNINNHTSISDPKIKLFIYTNQIPEKKVLNKINVAGASQYKGSLKFDELVTELNDSDILVHVESFDVKSIESTKLSLSTKIGEYLSLGKPILAIGPENIASMEYLNNVAYCINNQEHIKEGLNELLFDKELKKKLSNIAKNKYQTIINQEEKFKIESMLTDL